MVRLSNFRRDKSPVRGDLPKGSRLHETISSLVQWTAVSRLRMALMGSTAIVVFGSVFALWSYLAHLAVDDDDPVTLDDALLALDNREYESAKSLIGRLQRRQSDQTTFGGSLFVLGAVKAAEAEVEWSEERKRAVYLVAARYLQKAHLLGIPPSRESQARFLLGRSLVYGNQSQAGIEVLLETLDHEDLEQTTQIHRLLSRAYLTIPNPNLELALSHNRKMLEDETLDPKQRAAGLIDQADLLGKLGKLEEARKKLALLNDFAQTAQVKSVTGRLNIATAEQLPASDPQRAKLLQQAIEDLQEAQRLEPLNGQLVRQSMYHIGRCYEAQGALEKAIEQYNRVGKQYGDSSENLIATMAMADLSRKAGNSDQALANYRLVLDSVGEPVTYVNSLLPLSELRQRLLRAHTQFVDSQQFAHAMALVDHLAAIFSEIEVTHLRAMTFQKWGLAKQEAASDAKHLSKRGLLSDSRHMFRAAGRNYETLARLRFSTRDFTEDLWLAANNYFDGQSYTHTARVLDEFLHHEASKHNAVALLRLGQSYLAVNEIERAIESFEECIEMHPTSSAIYQARLECAHAYRQLGDDKKAAELMVTNLTGDTLEPTSHEWRDSLFALGQLQYDMRQYEDAIATLHHAVARDPNVPQALLAEYTIARSYHSAASEPADKIKNAKTENERHKNRTLLHENLNGALESYSKVQDVISRKPHDQRTKLEETLLRNCYMMQGSALFQLDRFTEALDAYSTISNLYQDDPFVLESFVHMSFCWRRLGQPVKARGTIRRAKMVLDRIPEDADFKIATNFDRGTWELLLEEMFRW